MIMPDRDRPIAVCEDYFMEVASNPFNYTSLISDGLREYKLTDDCKINGEEKPVPDILIAGFKCGAFEFIVFKKMEDEEPIGFHVISLDKFTEDKRRVLGHILYIEKENRGNGIWAQHLDTINAIVLMNRCDSFSFMSTLEVWKDRAPKNGFIQDGIIHQNIGPDVITWTRGWYANGMDSSVS